MAGAFRSVTHLSVRAKSTLVSFGVSVAVLTIAGALFILADQYTFQRQLMARTQTLASIAAENSKGAVAFRDAAVAQDVLASLGADPGVCCAKLFDEHDRLFASYRLPHVPEDLCADGPSPGVPEMVDRYIFDVQTVVLEGDPIGRVVLAYSTSPLQRRLLRMTLVALGILLAAGLAALMLSGMLHRQVTRPIQALIDAVRGIIRDEDFSIRAPQGAPDEIGTLARDINAMLERIQLRDAELQRYQERLRRMADRLLLSGERERRRIAVGIHDSICQMLWGAMSEASHLAGKSADAEQSRELTALASSMQDALNRARSLSFELSPPSLYDLGLGAALESLAGEMRDLHGLDVTVEGADVEFALDNDVGIVLYRAVRELLLNVVKHAGADEARVVMSRSDGTLALEIIDAGNGFDAERSDLTGDHGFGIFSIREHLRSVGGSLRIETAPGEGTKVRLEVPIG